jgi:hypothetical protein
MVPADRITAHAGMASGLEFGEHLLVWSWRKLVIGGGDCPVLSREFSELCGEDAGEVMATFVTFLRALAYASRRRLQVGHPGSMDITGDERQLLTLVASAQAGQAVLLEAHLRWLARAELRPAVAIATRALATALAAHGLLLPLPETPAPDPRDIGARFDGLPPWLSRGHAAP